MTKMLSTKNSVSRGNESVGIAWKMGFISSWGEGELVAGRQTCSGRQKCPGRQTCPGGQTCSGMQTS